MQMHVRAIKHGIAFADHRDGAAGIELRRQRGGRGVVEFAHRVPIDDAVAWLLAGHRIEQRQLRGAGPQMAGRDRAGVAHGSGLGEVDHEVGFRECPRRLEGHELGIARPDPDADEAAAHRPALAKALTAAAAIALPPMRPRTTRYGTPCGSAASAALDSAAPTNPTGTPMMAAGWGAPPASISIRRNKAVGAFPIATTAPPSRPDHSSSAAAERVVASRCARAGTPASCSVHTTSLRAGSRARV